MRLMHASTLAVLWSTFSFSAVLAQSPRLVWLLPFAGAPQNPMLGGDWSRAFDVSTDGKVVAGYAYFGGLESAFYAASWVLPGNAPSSLGTLQLCEESPNTIVNWSQASAISANGGVIAGGSGCPSAWVIHHAFRWEGGNMQDLGTLGGDLSWAHDISADGSVVVGWSNNNVGSTRAVRWSGGGIQDLGTLGGTHSVAYAVSADGRTVVGWAELPNGKRHAFLWRDGAMMDLGTLGGNYSCAYGVSEDGKVVVGESETYTGELHAFYWTPTTGMRDLGTLALGHQSCAYDVSASGNVVVGSALNESGQRRAVRWIIKGRGVTIEDLTSKYYWLLPRDGLSHLEVARAVTPDGRFIVGWGYNYTLTLGVVRAIGYWLDVGLIEPVPIW